MCGIVGFAGRVGIAEEMLRAMSGTMAHRGPDDEGVWTSADGTAGFGHRRLAVIDLSPGGHQPMTDGSGRVHIAFNGEIYNFRELRHELQQRGHAFHTASDTEVILAAYDAWGAEFLSHLAGMFALALYDAAEQRLILARDRAGEKPLFYSLSAERLVFASELKALFALPEFPRRLNRNALNHYLAFGYVPAQLCLIEGVEKLRPGHALRYDAGSGSVHVWQYWDLPPPPDGNVPPDEELVAELDRLLEAAVRKQLVADVPVGILLSGGVDSSLVTAMAARVSSRPVKTFTVTFPGHEQHDEAPFARLVAAHFSTDHTELPAATAGAELLPALARQYDEPIADSSMVPTYLVSRLIREHATVALGGDGGDELFGGYPLYLYATRLAGVQKLIPRPLRSAVGRTAKWLPAGVRGRNYLIAAGCRGFEPLTRIGLFFDEEWRSRLLAAPSETHPTPDDLRLELAAGAETLLQAAQRIDFRSYMPDDILVKVDRASMLASLETRAPFLDPAVVEFAYGRVPDRLKANSTERKILLRRLASRLLPPQLDLKRKQGFTIPIEAWLDGQWRGLMLDVLPSATADLFRRDAVDALLDGQRRVGNQAHRLFALLIFELWRREYRVTL